MVFMLRKINIKGKDHNKKKKKKKEEEYIFTRLTWRKERQEHCIYFIPNSAKFPQEKRKVDKWRKIILNKNP